MEMIKNHRAAARAFGMLFILTFIAYGLGTALVDMVVNAADGLAYVNDHKTQVVIGGILMAIVHTFANIALSVVMFRVLLPYHSLLSFGYLGAALMATVTLVIGAVFLLLILPLSDAYMRADGAQGFDTLHTLLKDGGFYAYQIGMAIWGMGGLTLSYMLQRSSLVPRVFPLFGYIGYGIFILGTIAELFGYGIGVLLSLPGGLFEITLSIWLIFKGFNIPQRNEGA